MKKFLLSILCLFGFVAISNAQTGNLLSNSGFEEWTDAKPTDWIESTSVSNATIEQSTDAHTGSYSVVVKGNSSSNKRFASKCYTLAAGTYVMSAYVKANGDELGHYRLGYVKVANGKADGSYMYSSAAATAVTTEWAEVTNEFTLTEESTISVLVMNNKNGKGASFLIDDFTLTVKGEGGEDGEDGEGEDETPELTTSTIADVIAAGAGNAKVEGTIVATYARGFLVSDATGSILVYLGSDNGHAVGDVVTVEGTTTTYGGLLQFGAGSTVEKTGTTTVTQPTPAVMSATDMDAYLSAPVIKYVEYTGTLTISGNYYNVAVEGTTTAIGSISYPKDGVVTAASGDKVKVTGYTIGVSSKYVNTMAVSVVKVDGGTTEPDEPVGEVYIEESFATDFGDFTQEQTVGTYEWVIDYSTAKMTSYVSGVNNASESWLISPSVDFTEETQAYIAFEYIIAYADATTLTENHQLLISKNYAGDVTTATWFELEFNPIGDNSFGSFHYTGLNIPAEFMGESELTFAFKYIGTETKAGTWEIKNLIVAHGEVEVVEPEPEPETIRCNVTEAIAAYVDGETKPAIVTGYIVGAFNGSYVAEFGSTVTIDTNILISDNADESDVANCLIVQLPKGDIRTALNLIQTPENYKKQVVLTGSIEKYFQTAGLKSVTAYEFTGETGIENIVNDNDAVKVIYDLTGRRIDNITKAGIYIVNGKKVLVK